MNYICSVNNSLAVFGLWLYWFDLGEGVVPLAFLSYNKMANTENLDRYEEYRLHMETLLSTHLIEFDLPLRILAPLERAGKRRLGDIVNMTRDELITINRLGISAVESIEKILSALGLKLKQ